MKVLDTNSGVIVEDTNTGDVWDGNAMEHYPLEIEVLDRTELVTEGSSTQPTVDDAVVDRETDATVDNEADINPFGYLNGGVVFESSNESIATVDSEGKVTRVADGTIDVTTDNGFIKRKTPITVSRTGGSIFETFNSWVDGSLAKDAANQIDSRIGGSPEKLIYSTQNHSGATYVRNASCWAANIDLTGVSPWNSRSTHRRAGTVIAEDCMVAARHFGLGVGDTVRFVKSDNSVVTMTVAAVQDLPQEGFAYDIQVVRFSENVPAGVKIYKVAPADLSDYLPNLRFEVPVLLMDQEEKALVADLSSVDGNYVGMKKSLDTQRLLLYEDLITGDSGNPTFLVVGGEPILLSTHTFGGAGAGPRYHALHTEINAAMDDAGSSNTLTVADLSAFSTY